MCMIRVRAPRHLERVSWPNGTLPSQTPSARSQRECRTRRVTHLERGLHPAVAAELRAAAPPQANAGNFTNPSTDRARTTPSADCTSGGSGGSASTSCSLAAPLSIEPRTLSASAAVESCSECTVPLTVSCSAATATREQRTSQCSRSFGRNSSVPVVVTIGKQR
jgi:hypothetical protein